METEPQRSKNLTENDDDDPLANSTVPRDMLQA